MKTKQKTVYACGACGYQAPRWMGRCPDCDAWGSLTEERVASSPGRGVGAQAGGSPAMPLTTVSTVAGWTHRPTGLGELDRVLGGGLVPASAVLIGGPPGIGKSTLLLQALSGVAKDGLGALYVTGEESREQVAHRAARLGVSGAQILILAETNLERIQSVIDEQKPWVVVVDSLQTVYDTRLESSAGTVSQLREVASALTAKAKTMGFALIMVGHVTKDGAIAGPRLIEHLVDTVAYFEEPGGQPFRMLRAVKNRFGATDELGIFEMRAEGLIPVTNPSEMFLAERPKGAPGSAVTVTTEGTRVLLVEIQALVGQSHTPSARRTALGIDPNRAALLIAILSAKVGYELMDLDVFVNVAGGIRLREPAADIAAALAIASSFTGRPIQNNLVAFGELGLTGEVRSVTYAAARVKEAAKLGFTKILVPKSVAAECGDTPGATLIPVERLADAIELALV